MRNLHPTKNNNNDTITTSRSRSTTTSSSWIVYYHYMLGLIITTWLLCTIHVTSFSISSTHTTLKLRSPILNDCDAISSFSMAGTSSCTKRYYKQRPFRRSSRRSNIKNSISDSNSISENCSDDDTNCLLEEMEQDSTDPMKKQRIKMSFVRSIQNSFYMSSSVSTSSLSSTFDENVDTRMINNSNDTTTAIPSSRQHQYNDLNDAAVTNGNSMNRYNDQYNIPTLQNGGTIQQLSLWCVPWLEVLGRSNVLFVHDAIYTNMFEELIRRHEQQQQYPMLFGHVYIPPTTKMNTNKKNSNKNIVRSWQDYSDSTNCIPIGTIMRITDYRRMNDGKLILYVQAIERFVITHVHQMVPYHIAQVQLLPDTEEITTIGRMSVVPETETIMRPLRNHAIVSESWDKWSQYEYSTKVSIPISSRTTSAKTSTTAITTISMSDVVGCALAKIVPFVPFDPDQFPSLSTSTSSPSSDHEVDDSCITNIATKEAKVSTPPIETRLLETGIYIEDEITEIIPISIRKIETLDEIEYRLWVVLNEYYIKSSTAISPFILSILPPVGVLNVPWPKGFLLEGIANVMQRTSSIGSLSSSKINTIRSVSSGSNHHRNSNNTNGDAVHQTMSSTAAATTTKVELSSPSVQHEFVRVSIDYPSLRRQKRLSYYVGQIVESMHDNIDNVQSIRQTLLRIPNTKLRLSYILSKLEHELFKIKLEKANSK